MQCISHWRVTRNNVTVISSTGSLTSQVHSSNIWLISTVYGEEMRPRVISQMSLLSSLHSFVVSFRHVHHAPQVRGELWVPPTTSADHSIISIMWQCQQVYPLLLVYWKLWPTVKISIVKSNQTDLPHYWTACFSMQPLHRPQLSGFSLSGTPQSLCMSLQTIITLFSSPLTFHFHPSLGKQIREESESHHPSI